MSCHEENPGKQTDSNASLTIALAGNPNCGKSALFNAFTGIRQKTGNWPGVTVDRKEGRFNIGDREVTAIDLPGIYSLDASSIDEEITRDYLLTREANLIVNIIDAANLERNLYLTVQLLEMGVPLLVAVNMMDVARKRGIELDLDKLSNKLGCPVVPIIATAGEGIDALKQNILSVADGHSSGGYSLAHEEAVEQAIVTLLPFVEEGENDANRHWLALKLLESGEITGNDALDSAIAANRKTIEERAGEETDIHIADSRYGHAHSLAHQVIRHKGRIGRTPTDHIDRVVLSRAFGIPIFLAVMYLMFMFTINIGGAFIDFFDGAAEVIFVDGAGRLLDNLGAPEWLRVVVADGIGGGIQIVATFIPIIAALYLFLSVVEDSGYMARAAFVMDRFMRSIGLPGKAFVPLIVGFGCNVPAVLATRTLENERERKLTVLMNPFMSCGARLPVYALFATAFFPHNGQNLVFALYLTGIIIAVLTGMIMKRTLLTGESSGFMMELPPYHLPTIKGVVLRTGDRVRLFLKDAGKVIIVMVMALNLLNSIGTDGSFGNEDSDKSVLSAISKTAVPAFEPMGINDENWPAVLGIFSGALAKEVVVGTLDTLYTSLSEEGESADEESVGMWESLVEAAATIPDNLAGVADMFSDPLGLNIGDVSDINTAAESQEVSTGTFGTMASRFDGQVGAIAYLLFILLYFPCVATLGAIKRETGGAWTLFVACWTTGIAYFSATVFYQAATFSQHPGFSAVWITSLVTILAVVVMALRLWAKRGEEKVRAVAGAEA